MSDLVTGDAVVLRLSLARPATRALALGVDLLVQAGLLALLGTAIAWAHPEISESLMGFAAVAVLVIVFVGYPTTMETLTRGKTLGKYALGLCVVSEDGGPVRFRQAFARGMAGATLDFLMSVGVIAFTVAMLSASGKRVGDVLAGTVVIREREPCTENVVPPAPPWLAHWARGLELSRLSDQLALSVRSYLTRYQELQPHARQALGEQLATTVAQQVAPAPPDGTSPRDYLAAVLAERRRRAADVSTTSAATRPSPPTPSASTSASSGATDNTPGGFTAPR